MALRDSQVIDAIDTLITAATLAPSGDNTQPWEFVANRSTSTIAVRLDKTRDSSPMNAGQRMARIACGAAIENILQTAEFNNWSATFKSFTASPLVGVVALTDIDGCQPGAIEQSIRDRCTNRNLYTTSPIPEGFVEEIKNGIEPLGDVSVRWIVRRDIMQIAAESIGDADAAMFGDRRFLLAFLENVRSDLPAQEVAEEGLPVGTLGLSLSERLLLPWLGSLSASRLVRAVLRHAFRRKAVSLASSSAGLCVISVSSEGVEADVAVGRMMQRVWLELTRRDMQVQPMMSLPVLRGFSEWSECACGESPANFKANAFDHCAPELRGAAAILRFG